MRMSEKRGVQPGPMEVRQIRGEAAVMCVDYVWQFCMCSACELSQYVGPGAWRVRKSSFRRFSGTMRTRTAASHSGDEDGRRECAPNVRSQ